VAEEVSLEVSLGTDAELVVVELVELVELAEVLVGSALVVG
jgi:hypothetical protein